MSSALRYVLASLASFSISFAGPILLHEAFGVAPAVAVAVCFATTFVCNFFTTKYFVYRSRGPALREFRTYAVTNVLFRGSEYACFSFLYLVIGIRYFIANFVVIAASSVVKFVVYDVIVYGKRDGGSSWKPRAKVTPQVSANGG